MNKLKISEDAVLAALGKVQEPELHKDLVTLNMIRDLQISGEEVSFTIMLTTPACPLKTKIEGEARQAVMGVAGVGAVKIKMDANVPSDGRARGLLQLPIRNAIAVASGKGGVGKSTVAVNIAVVLAQSGARVGLLDADIYGPNIPTMMGVEHLPSPEDGKLMPAEAYGVKMMSIGFLVKPDQPLIWRGPMLHSAIRQFLTDVAWGELDYLIVDLPPGTGDAALSLAQSLPLSGGVIVTLPQQVSLEDARRGAGDVPPVGCADLRRGREHELPGAAGRHAHGYLRHRRRRAAGAGEQGALYRRHPNGSHRARGRRRRAAGGDLQSRIRRWRSLCARWRRASPPASAWLPSSRATSSRSR